MSIPIARWTLYVATAGAMLVAAAHALGRLTSPWWIAGALAAYIALVVLGLAKPSLAMLTDAIVRVEDGLAILVDVQLDDEAASARTLLALFEAHDARATLALLPEDALKHRALVEEALDRGHGIALRERDDHVEPKLRRAALDARIHALERFDADWNTATQGLDPPPLWLPQAWYTPALQRVADAFDRILVAPTRDLRGRTRKGTSVATEREGASLETALVAALDHGAILRVRDSAALRAALPAVLDAAARLAVPVRALAS